MISKNYQRLAQQVLNERHQAGMEEDGIFGKKSRRAVELIYGEALSSKRGVSLVIQKEADRLGVGSKSKNDFYWGPVTEDEADRILAKRAGIAFPTEARPDEREVPVFGPDGIDCPKCRVKDKSGIRCRSPRDSEMRKFYGTPGSNQTTVLSPYPLRLDWDLRNTLTKFSAHKKVAISIEEALEEVLAVYGEDAIRELGLDRFAGCLNVRKKRGGSTWSTHAWGTALDFWAGVNRLRETHKTARFAQKQYRPWFDIWEKHGFISLGRCYDFDWMHIQKNPW